MHDASKRNEYYTSDTFLATMSIACTSFKDTTKLKDYQCLGFIYKNSDYLQVILHTPCCAQHVFPTMLLATLLLTYLYYTTVHYPHDSKMRTHTRARH